MDTKSNRNTIIALLLIFLFGGVSLVLYIYSDDPVVPDLGVSDVTQIYTSSNEQLNLYLEGASEIKAFESPFTYVLKWEALDTNNCSLYTDVAPVQDSDIEFIFQPRPMRELEVNTIGEQEFRVDATSVPANITHRLVCEDLTQEGVPLVAIEKTVIASNGGEGNKACLSDFNNDGIIDLNDLGQFALRYRRDLGNCSRDISGGDCVLNKDDFAIFETLYNVPGACK